MNTAKLPAAPTAATPRRVLVTGGGGFLGSAVVRLLQAQGHSVRSFSRSAHPHLTALGVEQQQGDLADHAAVSRAVAGMDAVVHAAAKAGVHGAYAAYAAANILGTRHVLAACRAHAVATLVYTSSPSVVFDGQDQNGVNESAPYPRRFLSPYPATKAVAEREVLAANSAALATVALRPHLIWGPGDPHLVPRVTALAGAGRLRFVGREDKLVDAVYIDNAAAAHVLALAQLLQARAAGQTAAIAGRAYFITNHEPWPMSRIINQILASARLAPVQRRVPAAAAYAAGGVLEAAYRLLRLRGEPPMTRFVARQLATAHWYDRTAAVQELGYAPKISMTEGFQRLAQHFEAVWDAHAKA